MSKFKVGDILVIKLGGYGLHPNTIGRTFTVAEIGKYMGGRKVGYSPVEHFSKEDITSGGFVSEESFELMQHSNYTPLIFN